MYVSIRSKLPCTDSIPTVPNMIDDIADNSFSCGKSTSSKIYHAPRQNDAEHIPTNTWYRTMFGSVYAANGDGSNFGGFRVVGLLTNLLRMVVAGRRRRRLDDGCC